MNEISYAQIQQLLSSNKAEIQALPKMFLLVHRNITIEPIVPYFRYLAYEEGFNAVVTLGQYDNVFQETVTNKDGLLTGPTDCVMVFLKLETLSPALAYNFLGLAPKDIIAETDRITEQFSAVLQGIRKKTRAMILWHGFEIPAYPSLGIVDSQINNGQLHAIHKLNEQLKTLIQATSNAFFVDLNLCLARVGVKHFYDPRYWHIARAPYSVEGLREIATEDFKFIRALKGKTKKCLVLDCDNTLWGGIIGEDGLPGIKLSPDYPGSAYYEFQKEILTLHHRGIIIALCSRNNEADVWEVFRSHPYMVLKEEHISAARINWSDKASNLVEIAHHLNIGLDSMVFLDDSEFEINLVRQLLPEVTSLCLPRDKPVEYRSMLNSFALFDTLTITNEDRTRGAMYKAESQRDTLRRETADLAGYLSGLEMVLQIRFADVFSVPRIAQQTQKTNQFNLTTRRYTEADIMSFMESDFSDVIYLKCSDKYGDLGIVGTCILTYDGMGTARFDTFLLSCRVLGRGVEDVFIAHALRHAKKKGCHLAIGEYCTTKKNSHVEYFFRDQGFLEIPSSAGPGSRIFHFDLDAMLRDVPNYFRAIHSDVDQGENLHA